MMSQSHWFGSSKGAGPSASVYNHKHVHRLLHPTADDIMRGGGRGAKTH